MQNSASGFAKCNGVSECGKLFKQLNNLTGKNPELQSLIIHVRTLDERITSWSKNCRSESGNFSNFAIALFYLSSFICLPIHVIYMHMND